MYYATESCYNEKSLSVLYSLFNIPFNDKHQLGFENGIHFCLGDHCNKLLV